MWIGAVVVVLLYSQVPQEVAQALAEQENAEAVTAAQAAQQAAQAAQKAAEAAWQAVELLTAQQKATLQVAQQKEAEEETPPPPSPWTTSANLSLIFLAGNSSSITLSGNVAVSYKTTNWTFGSRVYGAYGRARLVDADEFSNIAMQGGFQLRADRRFNSMLSAYALGGIDFDHIKSIEARPFIELGTGVVWIDNKVGNAQKVLLSSDFGLRYAYESRFRYYLTEEDDPDEPRNLEDVQVVAPRAAVSFRYMLTEGVTFGEDFEVLLNVIEVKRFWVNSTTKILVRLTNVFSVSTTLAFKYDSEPAEGTKKLDTTLSLGLDATF